MSLFSDTSVETLHLEKALGLTTLSNATFSVVSSGFLVYAAGCVAVVYDPELNQQKSLFKIDSAISALCVSPDGRYLAIGSRGADAAVYVYDISTGDELMELVGHKYGIGCLCFSHDSRLLVSCGFKLDKQMLCWNWRTGKSIHNKIGNKVNAVLFNAYGNYFVTCGDRHLKWWYFTKSDAEEVIEVKGFPASILEAQRYSNFTDGTFGSGSLRHVLYCSTAAGGICTFLENRIMDSYIQLSCVSANCMTLSSNQLYIGGADGNCLIYNISDLKCLGTLPKPDPLPKSDAAAPDALNKRLYPACYAVKMIPNSRNIAIVYSDRSMVIWDTTDRKRINIFRLLLNHRACIWDLHFLATGSLDSSGGDLSTAVFPPNTFLTCSADATIRIWGLDHRMHRYSKIKIPYCKDVFKIIQSGGEHTGGLSAGTMADVRAYDASSDLPDTEQPYRIQIIDSPRCMAVNPNGLEFACGDRTGRLKVFDINNLDKPKISIQAHDSEILSLGYSPAANRSVLLSPTSSSSPVVSLLASGGRDSLVHVFNLGSKSSGSTFDLISTLSLHESAVSIVKFTPDGHRLISCGTSDQKMVFSNVTNDGGVQAVTKFKSIPTPNGTVNGLAFDCTNKYAITSGQNKRLNIWNIGTGRQARSYFLEKAEGELYRSDIDPSGMFIVTCALDRKIRIFDFFSGDVIAEVYGHSDAITGVKFSPDGRYILSIGGDGCILAWRVPPTLVATMQDRLLELYTSAQKRLNSATEAVKNKEATKTTAVEVKTEVQAQKSATKSSEKISENLNHVLPTPPTVGVASVSDILPLPVPTTKGSQSRWVSRVKSEAKDGYELFGRKIDFSADEAVKARNKFTLEVSLDNINLEAVESGPVSASLSPGARIAEQLEAGDNVNIENGANEPPGVRALQAVMSDSPPAITESTFSKSPEKRIQSKEKELNPVAQDDDDLELLRASSKVESLHKSAVELEGWLENQLIGDVPNPKARDVLTSSLSAAYYAKLKDKGGEANVEVDDDFIEMEESIDGSEVFGDMATNLSPHRSSSKSTGRSSGGKLQYPDIEARRQKTAAAVDQMRDRLRSMGILQGSADDDLIAPLPPIDRMSQVSSNAVVSTKSSGQGMNKNSLDVNSPLKPKWDEPEQLEFLPPPPPYFGDAYASENVDKDDGTESTVSADDNIASEVADDPLDADPVLKSKLRDKTKECAHLLKELERVSMEAAAAVKDLQVMRSSIVSKSVTISTPHRHSYSESDLRSSPILVPSKSPTKRLSSKNVRSSANSQRAGSSAVLEEADEVISHFRICCSSLAESVSITLNVREPLGSSHKMTELNDDDFKMQHIISETEEDL